MPAKKKRNNKPKSSKKILNHHIHTPSPISIHHSSPTFPFHEQEIINLEEINLRGSSMEDSSSINNGKVDHDRHDDPKEVAEVDDVVGVESVKTLDIAVSADDGDDNKNTDTTGPAESKRDISILDEIIDKAEKILDDDSSSSSDSDEDKADEAKAEAVVEPLVESLVIVDDVPPIHNDDEGQEAVEVLSAVVEPSKAVYETPIETNVESSQIDPQTIPNPPGVPVEASSWKSCCGIFEVLRGSER